MNTKNTIKTGGLLAALTALFVLLGQAFGGTTGMLLALAFALSINGAAYWFSDRLPLAMARARPVNRTQAPELYHLVEDLARQAGVPAPRLYVVGHASPNAFATGRGPNHAAVAVTTGLLELLDRRELYGVLAHEFAHIKHRDILLTSIAAVMAGAITALAHLFQFAAIFGHQDDDEEGAGVFGALALLILAPIAATLLQLVLSRSREYAADATGARLARDPLALAGALRKLERGAWLRPMDVNPASASMYIVHPFTGGGMMRLFQTHPPVAERITRLEAMAGSRVSQLTGGT